LKGVTIKEVTMKNDLARRLGELLARLECNRTGEDMQTLTDCMKVLEEVLHYLPEELSRSAILARLIELARLADDYQKIDKVITGGLMNGRLRVLSSRSEVEDARNNEERKNFLIYWKQRVFVPVDWDNKGDQALVISVRQALGRIKRNG
jgi:hypothetical protein